MLRIGELFETDYWRFEGEKEFDSREEFENNFLDDFLDGDYLYLNGERDKYYAIWIMEYENEIIYYIPSGENYDYDFIEEILENFYSNDNPEGNGFIEYKKTNKKLPLLAYRGGQGYSYTMWQYIN